MTKTDHVFIAATDAGYHGLLADMIASVRRHRGLEEAPFAVFDLGLDSVQRDALAGQGVELATPEWHFDLDGRGFPRHQLGLLVRPFLRDYFPGRRVYAWIDADTWLQDAAAFGRLIAGARDRGFAIAHERDRGYRFQAWLTAWIAKHFVLGCGPVHGARLLTKPHLNAGIFAATDTAPHWESLAPALPGGDRAHEARRPLRPVHAKPGDLDRRPPDDDPRPARQLDLRPWAARVGRR